MVDKKINSNTNKTYNIDYTTNHSNINMSKIKTDVNKTEERIIMQNTIVEEINFSEPSDLSAINTTQSKKNKTVFEEEQEKEILTQKFNKYIQFLIKKLGGVRNVNWKDIENYINTIPEEFIGYIGMSFEEYKQRIKEIDENKYNYINSMSEENLKKISDNYLKEEREAINSEIDKYNEMINEVNKNYQNLENRYNEFVNRNKYATIINNEVNFSFQDHSIYNPNIYEEISQMTNQATNEQYIKKHLIEFEEFMGMTYEEYNQKLKKYEDLIAIFEGEKKVLLEKDYEIRQQAKEEPYIQASNTEEYKAYISANPNIERFDYLIDYKYLKEEQLLMYGYLYDFFGEEQADKYIEAIEDKINRAKGKESAEQLMNMISTIDKYGAKFTLESGNTIDIGAFITFIKGSENGAENFVEGIENFFDFDSDGVRSDNQYEQMYILQLMQENGQYEEFVHKLSYELGYDLGEKLIPVTAALTVGTATRNPKLGSEIAKWLTAISTVGYVKENALIDGESLETAYLYAIANGTSSYALETIFGLTIENGKFDATIVKYIINQWGIEDLSATQIQKLEKNLMYALKILKEGTKASTKEYYKALLQCVILGETIDLSELNKKATKEYIYSIINALTLNAIVEKLKKKDNVTKDDIRDIMYSEINGGCKIVIKDTVYSFYNLKELIDFYDNMGEYSEIQSVPDIISNGIAGVGTAVTTEMIILETLKGILLFTNDNTGTKTAINSK